MRLQLLLLNQLQAGRGHHLPVRSRTVILCRQVRDQQWQ